MHSSASPRSHLRLPREGDTDTCVPARRDACSGPGPALWASGSLLKSEDMHSVGLRRVGGLPGRKEEGPRKTSRARSRFPGKRQQKRAPVEKTPVPHGCSCSSTCSSRPVGTQHLCIPQAPTSGLPQGPAPPPDSCSTTIPSPAPTFPCPLSPLSHTSEGKSDQNHTARCTGGWMDGWPSHHRSTHQRGLGFYPGEEIKVASTGASGAYRWDGRRG